jgi:peptidoglycan/LPS O-acetylase OafA/YrhL
VAHVRQDRLAGVEAGRGIAAMLVVAVHAGHHLQQAYGAFTTGPMTTFGHSGVDFFFVLSGFIILHVHRGDIGQPRRLWHYLQRRISRIYPFYWIVLAATLVLLLGTRGGQALPSGGRLIADIALPPTLLPVTVGVAWTLQFELVFYACFAVLVVNRRVGQALFVAWLGFIAVGLAFGAQDGWALTALLSNYFGLEFFFGMLAAWFVSRRTVPLPGLWLALGAAWFLATGVCENAGLFVPTRFLPHLSYALASMAAVIGLVGCERAGRLRVPSVLTVLGGATYAIYLTHELSIGAVWQVLLRTGLDRLLSPDLLLLLLLTTCALVGVAACWLVERPAIALARAALARRRPDWPWRAQGAER